MDIKDKSLSLRECINELVKHMGFEKIWNILRYPLFNGCKKLFKSHIIINLQ